MTALTARCTLLPPYSGPPSLSSTASNAPVDAPLGTAALLCVPSSSTTSTSTVGFPRESRICLAWMASMDDKGNSRAASLLLRGSLTEPAKPATLGTPFAAPRQPLAAGPPNKQQRWVITCLPGTSVGHRCCSAPRGQLVRHRRMTVPRPGSGRGRPAPPV